MLSVSVLAALASVTVALQVVVDDPSNYADIASDAFDNTLLADYNISPIFYLISDLQAAYKFNGSSNITALGHESFSVDANDTDVILVSNGAELNLSFCDVLKEGYFSNLLQSSFFGVNAAINVQNASTVY